MEEKENEKGAQYFFSVLCISVTSQARSNLFHFSFSSFSSSFYFSFVTSSSIIFCYPPTLFAHFFLFHSRPLHQLKDALNFILAFFPLHLCGIFSSLWTMWDIILAATQNAQTHAWSWAQSLSLALVASTKDHWLGYLALLWNTIFMMNISFSLPLAA